MMRSYVFINSKIFSTDVPAVTEFITVAIDTGAGGEDDFAHDRFATLRTVANGFGLLIYSLPKTAGFHSLFQSCKTLWKAVERNNDLLFKLVS